MTWAGLPPEVQTIIRRGGNMQILTVGERVNLYGTVTVEVVAVGNDVTTFVFVDPKTKTARDSFYHENLVAYRNTLIDAKITGGTWSIVEVEGVTI